MNYRKADELLQGRCKARRKVGNNTYLERREGATIALRLHDTDILTFTPDQTVVDTGGWKTVTTKARLNEYLPFEMKCLSERGIWYLHSDSRRVPFADGMSISASGEVKGQGADPKALLKQRRQVSQYAGAFIEALRAGKVPAPSGGDCWDCALREVKTGKPLGELKHGSNGKASHIALHLKEKYFVPSLLHRALETIGASQMMWWAVGAYWGSDEQRAQLATFARSEYVWADIRKRLRRYILRQLGL